MTTLEKTVFFAAPPAVVWTYLTDAKKLGTWYHPAASDLEAGSDYQLLTTADDGSKTPLITGRVLEMDAPNRLVTTFVIGPFEGRETTLTWTLSETAGGTRLHLEHAGIKAAAGDAALPLFQALDKGWDEHFAKMREMAIAES
ncbi:SRPBCC family protein [Neptunicoccus cionae]|uniref:SRPBCC family protein n=1 Tax=Neptunicoccus cionae TaxID=2035344 RepID=UPI000C79492B|nr:SRPBCC domain-containing protein [Amylibacter cionae]PLS23103.1 SRPBCC domain-containing protein [Amylibacter cionae]